MRIVLLFILSHLIVVPAPSETLAETLSGPVKVIDAGSLRIAGQTVRLRGIATPAADDRCPFRTVTIACGRVATTALMDLTAGAEVECDIPDDSDRSRTIGATCQASGYDLSEGMVYTGYARPIKGAPARYREVEAAARKRKRGLWRGEFPDAVNEAASKR
ncbi:MAG: thermonuclease family protein [Alphaproteobacteria bacterium]|nr:thermonuclease family protein [Alphaproteobacteria bacterium]